MPIFDGLSTEWFLWWTSPTVPGLVILRRTNGEISTAYIWEVLKFKGDKKEAKVSSLPAFPK